MMRELRAGALRLFRSRERERERDHGGVLACTMIGITDLLLGVESVLDQGASGTLGLIVERLIDQRRNVGQLCLLEFGFQSESYFFIWRRAEKDFFPHFSLLWGARVSPNRERRGWELSLFAYLPSPRPAY